MNGLVCNKIGQSPYLYGQQEILNGCKANNRLCQEKLYRQFYPGLFALCHSFFRDKHDALTALNNGMLKVYKNIEQFDPLKASLSTWIYTIVRNESITLVKNSGQMKLVELQAEVNDYGSVNPFKQLEWKEIFLQLDLLPTATRTVCCLYYLEGFSIREIVEQLGIREGTVKWHLNESRTRLKQIFERNAVVQRNA